MSVQGLVLAGGGARGAYQVGVKRALDELGFQPTVFTGTSVGCLNACLFAQGMDEVAHSMWLTIADKDVMVMPEKLWGKDLLDFLHNVQAGGGMDVSPLEGSVRMLVDEAKLRSLPVKYGLITVNKRTLTPLEVGLDEIPVGQLTDYMMASAACFPAIRPHQLGSEEYIDGGYYENMPVDLAARLGATDIVAVNLDGIGFSRRPKAAGIRVRYVESYWPLGNILKFDPAISSRNIELGYLDTYRAWHKLKGVAYAFTPAEYKKLLGGVGVRLRELLDAAERQHPTFAPALKRMAGRGRPRARDPQTELCYLLEIAAQAVGLPPVEPYTCIGFCTALTEAFHQKHRGHQFDSFFTEDAVSPLTIGLALAQPERLLTEAAVFAADEALSAAALPAGEALIQAPSSIGGKTPGKA